MCSKNMSLKDKTPSKEIQIDITEFKIKLNEAKLTSQSAKDAVKGIAKLLLNKIVNLLIIILPEIRKMSA